MTVEYTSSEFSEFTISKWIIFEMDLVVVSMTGILGFMSVNKVLPIFPVVLMVGFIVRFSLK